MPSSSRHHAFTLVELLVVIGIIAVLIGIILPSLRGARASAVRLQCLSNLRQLGSGLIAYTVDNKGSYPWHEFWYNQSGKRGDLARFGIAPFPPIDQTGLRDEAGTIRERPLNVYLGQNALVSSCPADRGDAKKPTVTSCFDAYGTSFQIQWNDGVVPPTFGVVPVTGYSVLDATTGTKTFDLTKPAAKYGAGIRFGGAIYKGDWSRKIILGDFNWHGNRPITDQRVLWHQPIKANVRQQNMLFGDGHAEFFTFPKNYGSATLPVDASLNGFW